MSYDPFVSAANEFERNKHLSYRVMRRTAKLYREKMIRLQADLSAANEKLAKAKALQSYVRHRDNCAWKTATKCFCGLKQTLAAIGEINPT